MKELSIFLKMIEFNIKWNGEIITSNKYFYQIVMETKRVGNINTKKLILLPKI